MSDRIYSVITGTGSYIPSTRVENKDFLVNEFYDSCGSRGKKSNHDIIETFLEITTIFERRHAASHVDASGMACSAAREAISSSGSSYEEFDYILLAHNFGDIASSNARLDVVPSLAARVKHQLKIENPNTIAYDILFGCPGWLQAIIQADYYIKSGDATKILVVGAETLSRVSDPHDRDSMLYADGAGAVVLEAKQSDEPIGILAHNTRSDTLLHSELLRMGKSYNPTDSNAEAYLKMDGRKLYQYALGYVPLAIKVCLERAGLHIDEVRKFLMHQANGKMDDAILKRLYSECGISTIPQDIMPMTISWLGNSSVATLPTLLDLVLKEKLNPHRIHQGDIVIFASVGAGMNINAVAYKAC